MQSGTRGRQGKGEAPLNQIVKGCGLSEGCLHAWMKKADIEDGARSGPTAAESVELHEAKKRIRLLEQEAVGSKGATQRRHVLGTCRRCGLVLSCDQSPTARHSPGCRSTSPNNSETGTPPSVVAVRVA
jgi:hypothetical protein